MPAIAKARIGQFGCCLAVLGAAAWTLEVGLFLLVFAISLNSSTLY
jgi:hypothetical protein